MANIKNIIFDYGGVIIDIDYSLTQKAFEDLGIKNFEKEFSQASQASFFDDFETGKISEESFRHQLNNQLREKFSDQQIDKAWNAMLQGIRPEKIQLLKDLKEFYHTFLLSNTNLIHIRYISGYLLKTYGRSDIEDLFNRIYYSYQMGLRKPHEEIFQQVISENGLKPSETLYIDDSIQNVKAAKALGFISVQYSPSENLRLFLEQQLDKRIHKKSLK